MIKGISTVYRHKAEDFSIEIRFDTVTWNTPHYDVIMSADNDAVAEHTLIFTVQSVRQVADLTKMFLNLVCLHNMNSPAPYRDIHEEIISTLLSL